MFVGTTTFNNNNTGILSKHFKAVFKFKLFALELNMKKKSKFQAFSTPIYRRTHHLQTLFTKKLII